MCGIAGFVTTSPEHKFRDICGVLQRLQHRGPDDYGYLLYSRQGVEVGRDWRDTGQPPDAVLLHRRLSILDLSQAGWQPMSTRDGRYSVVFNGEIYNYLELRQELECLGRRFDSRSDTEVLLAAYSEWGPQALTKAVGMFALAILDTKDRKLFLARDCFGIKPLYYAAANGCFAFASEVKVLLDFDFVSREVNPHRLYPYLRHGVSDYGAETLFADVFQVPPGHYMELSLDRPFKSEAKCYWKPSTDRRSEISFEEAAQRVRELFLKNVSLHLRSDVPLGTALSGGIDSSAIVMSIRYLCSQAKLHCFSYIADDPAVSEEHWIDEVSQTAGADVHKVRLTAGDLVQDLDRLTYVQDEPFGSTSIYASYGVFREAQRKNIKVMLDGQGADEIFGGYRVYMAARLASLLRQRRWREAHQFLANCSELPDGTKAWFLLRAGKYLLPLAAQVPLRKLLGEDLAPRWLNMGWFRGRGIRSEVMYYSQDEEVLKASLYRDLTGSLPRLLRYEDRNSMAFSVESRLPFLTAELVDFVYALPEEYLIDREGTSKAVFRRAMRGIVPDRILDRKDKIGFATPERKWLGALEPWVEKVINSEAATRIPVLNLPAVRREWQAILQGKRRFNFHVWRWLNVIEWSRQFGTTYN